MPADAYRHSTAMTSLSVVCVCHVEVVAWHIQLCDAHAGQAEARQSDINKAAVVEDAGADPKMSMGIPEPPADLGSDPWVNAVADRVEMLGIERTDVGGNEHGRDVKARCVLWAPRGTPGGSLGRQSGYFGQPLWPPHTRQVVLTHQLRPHDTMCLFGGKALIALQSSNATRCRHACR